MKKQVYCLAWNRENGDYYCDGTYWSSASYRRHLRKVISHYENGEGDWTILTKHEKDEPLRKWEINLPIKSRTGKTRRNCSSSTPNCL
jgi:hypothetical protein